MLACVVAFGRQKYKPSATAYLAWSVIRRVAEQAKYVLMTIVCRSFGLEALGAFCSPTLGQIEFKTVRLMRQYMSRDMLGVAKCSVS